MGKAANDFNEAHAATLAELEETRRQLAEAHERIEALEEQALTDPLTGLTNRRGFEDFFTQEQARLQRGQSQGGMLLLIDLDRFKSINDTYGHQAGDACLNAVADKLREIVRNIDGIARFGGDEFAVMLTQLDEKSARQKIVMIQRELNDLSVEWKGQTIRFGASVGGTWVTAQKPFEKAYTGADRNLYAAKRLRTSQRLSARLMKPRQNQGPVPGTGA